MDSPSFDKQTIELFHLLFLQQLAARLDKRLYALKGGSNLRFFFRSVRYSEDLDLDVQTTARETLRKNVNQILEFQGFTQILRSHRVAVSFISEPKQTETTQRWKIHLHLEDRGFELPTKIEFSRRGLGEGIAFEAVDPEVTRLHRLRPTLTTHYTLETAFIQKIEALIHRSETQARDVFDLKLLLDAGAKGTALPRALRKNLATACENAISIRYDDFKGQVVAYLAPEYQEFYDTRAAWETLQEVVIKKLEGL
jgi:predicted nucleotidyltransferase component of viral defense system